MKLPPVSIEPWRGGKRAAVALTFDDWTPGQALVALPALERAGFLATFFVPLVHFELDPELDHWGRLQELLRAGHELGSHSASHTDLRGAPRSTLYNEVTAVKEKMEAELFGARVDAFCYPYGKYDAALLDEVQKEHLVARAYDEDEAPLDLSYDFASSESDYFRLRPLRVNAALTTGAWQQALERSVSGGGLLTTIFHGVFNAAHPRDASWFDAIGQAQLERMLSELRARAQDLWVTPLTEAVKYHHSARAARVESWCSAPLELTLQLSTPAGHSLRYATPLTVTVEKLDGRCYEALLAGEVPIPYQETESSIRFELALCRAVTLRLAPSKSPAIRRAPDVQSLALE